MKFAKRIEAVAPSATLAITAKAKDLKAKGVDVVNFAAGEPDFDTPDFIKDEAIKAIRQGFTKYTPTSGTPELKAAITDKFLRDNDLRYEPSQIVVSCGAKHSLYNALQVLCDENDEVIITSPYWVSYPEMVRLAGGTSRFVTTFQKNNFIPKPEEIREAITKRTVAIIINSPSNPTGAVYSRGDLEGLAELAAARNLVIITDEIYEKIIYDGTRHISIASLGDDIYKRTIVVNGVSKAYSMTGWRIGYLGAPKELADAIGRLQDHSTSNPSSISQRAATAALAGDGKFTERIVGEFKVRRDYIIEHLSATGAFQPFKPQGAFYIFCDISKMGVSSQETARRLLEEASVAVIPCEGFGSSGHIRISFATSMPEVKKGVERIREWARRLQKRS